MNRARSRGVMTLTALCLVAAAASAQRLFFDTADIPAIRARLSHEPFSSMLGAIESQLDPNAGDAVGLSSSQRVGARANEARNAASMYVLTGHQAYADRALEMTQALIAETDIWAVNASKGLRRAEMAAAVTQAFDFSSGAWDPIDRAMVASELVRNADSIMASGGSGWPGDHATANNWHGVRWSSAIISYLAADDPTRNFAIDVAYDNLLTHFEANLAGNTAQRENGRGWNPEGMGYTQWPSNRSWGQAAVAMNRLRGRDLLADGPPGLKYTLSTAHLSAVAIQGIDGYVGLVPDFADDGNFLTGRGLGNFAFAHSPEEYLPALRWQYDRLWGAQGGGNYDTADGAGIWGILYYPDDVAAQNPADVWGLNYVDEHFAMTMFRDRYQDENDLVAMHSARWRNANGVLENTHWGPDVNGLRVIGLNSVWATSGKNDARHQTTVSGVDPAQIGSINPDRQGESLGFGTLNDYYTHDEDGSGYSVVTGTDMGDSQSPTPLGTLFHTRRFGVDYDSALTGDRAVFVVGDTSLSGNFWRWNAGGMNTIAVDRQAGGFTITSPDGHRLIGTIIHGDPSTLRQGTVERSRDIPYEGSRYDTNVWIDFEDSGDNDFLVILQMVELGDEPSAVHGSGTGAFQSLRVGRQSYHVESGKVWAESWNGWTTGDGDWGDPGNWRFGVPRGDNAWATFAPDTPIEVTADDAVTLSSIVMSGEGDVRLSGEGVITLASPVGVARVEASRAGGRIDSVLRLEDLSVFNVAEATSLSINKAITLQSVLVKEGSGVLELGPSALSWTELGSVIAVLGGEVQVSGHFALSEIDATAIGEQLADAGIDLSKGLTVFEVTATVTVPGDYNADGVVDSADYTIWRDVAGTVTELPNDEVGGSIGLVQYDTWAANFGSSVSATTAPEPSTELFALMAVPIAWRIRPICHR